MGEHTTVGGVRTAQHHKLCPDMVSRRGATDAGDGSAVLPGAYVLPRGVSPLAGCPSLATGWSFSIGNLLNLNTIPCVEPLPCGGTVHNGAATEYLDGNVTFGFVDTSDTRDIRRPDALTPQP